MGEGGRERERERILILILILIFGFLLSSCFEGSPGKFVAGHCRMLLLAVLSVMVLEVDVGHWMIDMMRGRAESHGA